MHCEEIVRNLERGQGRGCVQCKGSASHMAKALAIHRFAILIAAFLRIFRMSLTSFTISHQRSNAPLITLFVAAQGGFESKS